MNKIIIFNLIFGFPDAITPTMEGIIDLHNYIFFFLTFVLLFVMWIMLNILYYFYYQLNFKLFKDIILQRYLFFAGNHITHSTGLEIAWTLLPAVVLLAVAIPSFALLYSIDEVTSSQIIIKIVGHQWYWGYEYADYSCEVEGKKINFPSTTFDSYMIPETELSTGQTRLLETDHILTLPANVHIKFLITAADVLHSWAVPSLGIKVDAVPGRLSQANAYIKNIGQYQGQCSEICGVNHGFMPIVLKILHLDKFLDAAIQKKPDLLFFGYDFKLNGTIGIEDDVVKENDDVVKENDDVVKENDDVVKENDDVVKEKSQLVDGIDLLPKNTDDKKTIPAGIIYEKTFKGRFSGRNYKFILPPCPQGMTLEENTGTGYFETGVWEFCVSQEEYDKRTARINQDKLIKKINDELKKENYKRKL